MGRAKPASTIVPQDQWRPGRSVAHKSGMAGTIGVFVDLEDPARAPLKVPKNAPRRGLVSAAHVLAPPGVDADMGDKILSPGPPEVEAMARYRCAQLSNFTELSPPGAGPKPVINPHDCALAVMSDAGIKVANVVPNPNDPRRLVALKGCHSESELKALVRATARVFMLGSSSGFSRGQLVDENSGTVGLKVRTGELYYYKSCHVIEGGNAKIGFSQPGDSGALVYSEDLKAVGFVVGAKNMEDGKGLRTFIYNAAAVLRLLDVRLPP